MTGPGTWTILLSPPDLDAGVQRIPDVTGLQLGRGGSHPHWGTRNYLATFGDGSYFELISADLENTDFSGSRPFKVEEVSQMQAVALAIEPPSVEENLAPIAEAGFDLGQPVQETRRSTNGELLQWRLIPPFDGPSGIVPFLLDWSGLTTPAVTIQPQLILVAMRATHPEAERYTAMLKAMETDLDVTEEPGKLEVILRGPEGRITV